MIAHQYNKIENDNIEIHTINDVGSYVSPSSP